MKAFADMCANLFALVAIVGMACFVGALYLSPVLVPLGLLYVFFHFASKYW